MTRSHIFMTLAAAAATAAAGGTLLSSPAAPCFSAGGMGYRLTTRSAADFTIKIDNAATQPDLTLQVVSDPDTADFVLVDGAGPSGGCRDARAVRTIRIDPNAAEPDLTIAMADGSGRYKLYARSSEFNTQDAAALFAVIWKAGRKLSALRSEPTAR